MLDFLKATPKNAPPTAKTIKNEAIDAIAALLHRQILTMAKGSQFFFISMKETMDSGTNEQLSLSSRFTYEDLEAGETRTSTTRCYESTCDHAIAEQVLGELLRFSSDTLDVRPQVSLKNLKGQACDGSDNIVGLNKWNSSSD